MIAPDDQFLMIDEDIPAFAENKEITDESKQISDSEMNPQILKAEIGGIFGGGENYQEDVTGSMVLGNKPAEVVENIYEPF